MPWEDLRKEDWGVLSLKTISRLVLPDRNLLLQQIQAFLQNGLLLGVQGEPPVQDGRAHRLGEVGERPEVSALRPEPVQKHLLPHGAKGGTPGVAVGIPATGGHGFKKGLRGRRSDQRSGGGALGHPLSSQPTFGCPRTRASGTAQHQTAGHSDRT